MEEYINNKVLVIYKMIKETLGYRWDNLVKKMHLENNEQEIFNNLKSILYDNLAYIYQNALCHIYCDEFLLYGTKIVCNSLFFENHRTLYDVFNGYNNRINYQKDLETNGFIYFNYSLFIGNLIRLNTSVNNIDLASYLEDCKIIFQKQNYPTNQVFKRTNIEDICTLISAYLYINKINIRFMDIYNNVIGNMDDFYEWLMLNGLFDEHDHLYVGEFVELIPSLINIQNKCLNLK